MGAEGEEAAFPAKSKPCGPSQRFFLRGIEKLGEHHLEDYFQQFGDITEITVLRDKKTKRPRGMGFLAIAPKAEDGDDDGEAMSDEDRMQLLVQRITGESHTVGGVLVELQEALPKIDEDDAKGAAAKEPTDAESGGVDVTTADATSAAPAKEQDPVDEAAQAKAKAQFMMHYLAMAINTAVPDMATVMPQGGKGARAAPYGPPPGVQPKGAVVRSGMQPKAAMARSGMQPKATMAQAGMQPKAALAQSGAQPKAAAAQAPSSRQ